MTGETRAALEAGVDTAQQVATLAMHGRHTEVAQLLDALDEVELLTVAFGLLDVVVAVHHAWSQTFKLDEIDMRLAWAQLLGAFQTLRDRKAAQ